MAFPETSILDSFDRSDETPMAGNWTGGTFESGAVPYNLSGSSVLIPGYEATACAYWNAASFGPDAEVYLSTAANLIVTVDWFRLYLRMSSPASPSTLNCYGLELSAYNFSLFKVVGGSLTVLDVASFPSSYLATGVGLSVQGTTLKSFVRISGSWSEVSSVTDSAVSGSGFLGFASFMTSEEDSSADDFGGGTLAGAPPGGSADPRLESVQAF